MNKNEELLSLLFSLGRVIKGKMQKTDCFSDFSHTEIEILKFLEGKDKSTMKEVAEYLRIKPSSATPLIDALVDKKNVERLQDKNDRRLIYIKINKLGKNKLKNAYKHANKNLNETFGVLNEKDKQELINILTLIVKDSHPCNL